MDLEAVAKIAVDCGFKVHQGLGPGLLESVYEAVLAQSLSRRGRSVERQKPIPIRFEGVALDEGFRADLLVKDAELRGLEVLTLRGLAAPRATLRPRCQRR